MNNKKNLNPSMNRIKDFNKDSGSSGNGGSSQNNAPTPLHSSQSLGQQSLNNNNTDTTPDILINYNEAAENDEFNEAFYRDAQILQIVSVLQTRKKPNALMKGDAGVGKTQIVEEMARRIVNDDPIVGNLLKGVTIYELPLSSVVSGAGIVGQLEQNIEEVIDFAQDPDNNAIIFIDEIHQLMAGSSNPTYDKIAQVLKPAIDRGKMRLIGATTTQEATSIMSDPAFSRRWSDVFIPELSVSETEEIIENIRHDYQIHHNVLLPDHLIEHVVKIGDEHKQYGSHRPDTSITLLDKAMSDEKIKRVDMLHRVKADPHLQYVIDANPMPTISITNLKKSALTLLTGDDKMYNRNTDELEASLNDNIIGQLEAKSEVVDAVKRLGLSLTKRVRPTSFLFAGQTGTGKTEVAKLMAKAIFGSDNNFININLSEYASSASMTRISGSSAGYIGSDSKRELPFDTLETNPYQLILLDEFEKAHPDVQQFFMQALEEGEVKTNRNTMIDFSRTIIVATTNAGVVEMSKKNLGFGSSEPEHTADDVLNMLKGDFAIELLNRFEKIIPFTSINKDEYTQILAVKYNQMIKEAQNSRRDLDLSPDNISLEDSLSNDTLINLANISYTVSANGRPAERTIRKHIEDVILNDTNATHFKLI